MAKILLNTNKPNQINIEFCYFTENYVKDIEDNFVSIPCFYNKYDTKHIDYKVLTNNFSMLLEAYSAFDSDTHIFNFKDTFSDYEIVSILIAIDKNLNDDYSFIFNVVDVEKTKNIIKLYKELTTKNELKEAFLKKQKEHTLKESSYVFSKLIFDYKPDYSGKKLLIIDTHNKYHRDYNAMPHMKNSDGQETMVIKSFLKMIQGIEKNKPDYIILATEGKDGIRYKMFSDYKKDRKEPEEALVSQIKEIERMSELLGLSVVGEEGYEADDIIASYTKKFVEFGGHVQIVTTDKDIYQLLSDNVSIYNPVTKKIVKKEDCLEKFKVSPENMRLFLALKGDTSDGVPGVKGVGDMKAAQYINDFGNTIEKIIEGAKTLKEGSAARKNLENGIEDLKMSYDLVQLFDYLAEYEYDFERFKFPSQLNWNNIEEDIKYFQIMI